MERAFPDGAADERGVLTGFLDWQRATVRRKVDGLPSELADRALLDTSPLMTVAGIVSHLRQTEHDWFAGSFPKPPLGGLIDDLYYLEGAPPYARLMLPPMPGALLIVNLGAPFRIGAGTETSEYADCSPA